jgi:bacteriocin-like protein
METNRVLSRAGARLLSEEELQQITGGFKSSNFFGSFNTGACNWDPVACRVISGDCADDPPPCFGQ